MERIHDPLEGGTACAPLISTASARQHSTHQSSPAPGFHQCFLSLPFPKDIKYIEVTSTRSRGLEGPQRCSSPCATPPFGSPRNGSLLFSRDIPRETRSSSESLIFSGNQGRGPSPHTPSSLSNSSPGGRESRASGSPLATPPGWEKGPRAPQRGSRVSVLSASPTSDVSYVFGR